jgi:hypothetical protein
MEGGKDLISINKTKDLWNRDPEFTKLNNDIGPLCCWFWCWWVGGGW